MNARRARFFGEEVLLRLGRHVFWRSPWLYRPIGAWRHRYNPRLAEYDIWVGGYPRSSSTFTRLALQDCFANLKVVSHIHLPPPIIRAVRRQKPGVFLIRRPEDAIISWVQYTNLSLRHCVDYYVDFHRILAPYRHRMLVVRFEQATTDAAAVIRTFAQHYHLEPRTVEVRADQLFSKIDSLWKSPDGSVNEMQVARPSDVRDQGRQAYLDQIRRSRHLQAQMVKAEALYRQFIGNALPKP